MDAPCLELILEIPGFLARELCGVFLGAQGWRQGLAVEHAIVIVRDCSFGIHLNQCAWAPVPGAHVADGISMKTPASGTPEEWVTITK